MATNGVLLDARAPERYRGESEPLDRVAGHIPGARNWPMARNLDKNGRLKPPEELSRAFAELADGEVGTYCGSGITAAHTVLALELAGIEASLYPGSWSEWVSDLGENARVLDVSLHSSAKKVHKDAYALLRRQRLRDDGLQSCEDAAYDFDWVAMGEFVG